MSNTFTKFDHPHRGARHRLERRAITRIVIGVATIQTVTVCLAGSPTPNEASIASQFAAMSAPASATSVHPGLALTSAGAAQPDLTTVPTVGADVVDRFRQTLYMADMGSTSQPGGTAPPTGSDATDLAKKLANPLASMISVPFQYNADFNAGVSGHAHRSYMNMQPVIPLDLDKDWNLITRTIVPLIYQEEMAPGQSTNTGLGDVTASFFFSPKEPANGWIWGVGPVAYLPTATDTALGTGQWGGGITGVALRQEHGWTYGVLANHIWSICDDADRPSINASFFQPFVAYTWPTATTVSLNAESTYDWNASQWTFPVNLMVSQIFKVGGMPLQFQIGGRYYAEGPSGAPEFGVRFGITFLLPK